MTPVTVQSHYRPGAPGTAGDRFRCEPTPIPQPRPADQTTKEQRNA